MLYLVRAPLLALALAFTAISGASVDAQPAHLVQGSKDASVQILFYGDLQCPYCARVWTYMEKFKADYGDKIGISFAHFPLQFHPNALPAAISAECAHRQGKFTEFIDGVFKKQTDMSENFFITLAQRIGVKDMNAFAVCTLSPATKEAVEADRLTGLALAVSGTPYIYINGKLINGAYPYDEFKKAIDAALAK